MSNFSVGIRLGHPEKKDQDLQIDLKSKELNDESEKMELTVVWIRSRSQGNTL